MNSSKVLVSSVPYFTDRGSCRCLIHSGVTLLEWSEGALEEVFPVLSRGHLAQGCKMETAVDAGGAWLGLCGERSQCLESGGKWATSQPALRYSRPYVPSPQGVWSWNDHLAFEGYVEIPFLRWIFTFKKVRKLVGLQKQVNGSM